MLQFFFSDLFAPLQLPLALLTPLQSRAAGAGGAVWLRLPRQTDGSEDEVLICAVVLACLHVWCEVLCIFVGCFRSGG